jgi:transposase
LTGGKKTGRFNESIKFDYMSRRVFDTAFKKMAVELSYARGSVKEAATELGIDADRITKWHHQQQGSGEKTITALTQEQREIRRLQKALKEAQLERDILKKAVSISRIKFGILDSPGETGDIRIHKGAPQPFSRQRRCARCSK